MLLDAGVPNNMSEETAGEDAEYDLVICMEETELGVLAEFWLKDGAELMLRYKLEWMIEELSSMDELATSTWMFSLLAHEQGNNGRETLIGSLSVWLAAYLTPISDNTEGERMTFSFTGSRHQGVGLLNIPKVLN